MLRKLNLFENTAILEISLKTLNYPVYPDILQNRNFLKFSSYPVMNNIKVKH